MEQDDGKISGLAQTLQSSPDPVPIRCTVPRASTLNTATALPKRARAYSVEAKAASMFLKYPLFTTRSFD
ncbi:hypothetical protein B0H13DRAFT_2331091 [Mycena leptocephala]|nr:hypothetical protein B0H13DRAFT_2331091 [Mycena leptocephala]